MVRKKEQLMTVRIKRGMLYFLSMDIKFCLCFPGSLVRNCAGVPNQSSRLFFLVFRLFTSVTNALTVPNSLETVHLGISDTEVNNLYTSN